MNPYPSTQDLRRERNALQRDHQYCASLKAQRAIIAKAYELLVAEGQPAVNHPEARYSTVETIETVRGLLADIDDTLTAIRNQPLALDPDE